MSNIKFIHCADIHLGSIVNINDVNKSIIEGEADFYIEDALKKIVDLAIEENIDFILLSGDIFDTENLDVRTDKMFLLECMRLKKSHIKLYIIAGNHDPLDEKKYLFSLPDNVYVFRGEKVSNVYYEKNSKKVVNIIGISYRKRYIKENLIDDFNELKEDNLLNIAMLHTALDSNEKYAPCTIEQLKRSKMDYWALGHIHKNRILNRELPTIVYPGIPQGRDFGEQQCGGVYLVEYEDQSLKNIEYRKISGFIYKDVNIKLTEQNGIYNIESLDYFCELILNNVRENLGTNKDDHINFIRVNIESEFKVKSLEDMKQKDILEFRDYINSVIGYSNENFIVGALTYNYYPKSEEVNIEEYILKLILEEVEFLKDTDDLNGDIGEMWTSKEEKVKDTVFLLDKDTKDSIISEVLRNIINELS